MATSSLKMFCLMLLVWYQFVNNVNNVACCSCMGSLPMHDALLGDWGVTGIMWFCKPAFQQLCSCLVAECCLVIKPACTMLHKLLCQDYRC
jgi:hypothetical protein